MYRVAVFENSFKWFISILIPILLVVGLLMPAPVLANPGTLDLIGGAWDHTDITVKINYNNSIPQDVVDEAIDAVGDWNAAIDAEGSPLSDFNLVIVERGKADITVTLRKGTAGITGVIGHSVPSVSKDGSFHHARIVVSIAAFGIGYSPTFVGNIVRHELGHGLGLGHYDLPGDLMSSTLTTPESEITISSLDILGFATAHDWYPGDFEPPTVTSVSD